MMIPEVELQALRFFTRAELEGPQMHARHMRDVVNGHAKTLPLRHIHRVDISFGTCYIHPTKDRNGRTVCRQIEYYIGELLPLVNNAFVGRLMLIDREDDIVFLRYLQAHAATLQCRIQTLRIEWSALAFDSVLLDFIGTMFKPQIYSASLFPICLDARHIELPILLFTRTTFCDKVKHLFFEIHDAWSVLSALIPELFRADVLQSCFITVRVSPHRWLNDYVEAFEATLTRGSRVTHTVVLLYAHSDDDAQVCTAVEQFAHRHGDHVPVPECAYVNDALRASLPIEIALTESATAQRYVFENRDAAKKLEVLFWQVVQAASTWSILHNVFYLQLVDI
ncbi:hypothetical protein AAVH_18183 [Aphelenchoides avenae]|nr:hypothetical protein AAVH_18183 [Aphelenchus avenae]